jgi:predicted signal transduction protein with EAL and GGDEF domain
MAQQLPIANNRLQLPNRVTRLGVLYALWALMYLKIREVALIFGQLYLRLSALIVTENVLGYILGNFLQTHLVTLLPTYVCPDLCSHELRNYAATQKPNFTSAIESSFLIKCHNLLQPTQRQGCQIFLGATFQKAKIYQMAVKYKKWQ